MVSITITRRLLSFQARDSFKLPNKLCLQWYPGHMGKGMKQIQQKLKSVDCVVEVHDARIPFSGRNPMFEYTLNRVRPHILVLNKKDLIDNRNKSVIESKLVEQGVNKVIFTNCKDQNCSGAKKIMPLAIELITKSDRFNRTEVNSYCIMIIGVPNVGKSSLLNYLRNKYLKKSSAARVGAIAGITRSVPTEIKVSENPSVYVLDTPGILTPNIPDTETGMRLALCSSLQDHLVGIELIADYLLYWLNKNKNYKYVDFLGTREPCDKITEALVLSAVNKKRVKKVNRGDGSHIIVPDTAVAAAEFVKAFRTGEFGKIMLDYESLS